MHRTALVVLALTLATLGAPLSAQRDPVLRPGDRIRLSVPQAFSAPVVGTLVGTSPGHLHVFRTEGRRDTVDIPVALVRTVEVSRGQLPRGQRVRRGLVRGLGAGVMVGAVLGGALAMGVDEREGQEANEAASSARFALGFGAVGLAAGGLLGMRPRENWERLVLPAFSVAVQGPSVTFSFRI